VRSGFSLIACAASALLTTACEGLVVVINPSGILVVSIASPALTTDGCPESPSAHARADVLVRGVAEELLLSAVTLTLTDARGSAHQLLSYKPAEINKTFGSLLVPAAGVRRLTFSVPFNCSPPGPAQLSVHVAATTRSGRMMDADATASF